MEDYRQSQDIASEAERLRLISITANESSRAALSEIAEGGFSPSRILDAGCGTGDAFAVIKEIFPQAEIVGIDQSAKAVELAEQRGIATDVLVANMLSIAGSEPLKSKGVFDLVFVRNTLVHVPDVATALTQLKSVVREKGMIVAQEPDWDAANANWQDFNIFKTSMMAAMRAHGINPTLGQGLDQKFNESGLSELIKNKFEYRTHASDEGWKVLEYLLEVSQGIVEPYLQQAGVASIDEMINRIRAAQQNPENYFNTPAWIVVSGVKTK